MKSVRPASIALAAALSLVAASAAAQTPAAPSPEPAEAAVFDRGEIVQILGDAHVAADERAREVVVIGGTAVIEGRVRTDVILVAGTLKIAGTGRVGGDVVVVAGSAEIEAGAQLAGSLVTAGAGLTAPSGFKPRGEMVSVGTLGLGGPIAAMVPWLTEGLFWGRPIAPRLPWVWAAVCVLALVYLALNFLFERPIRSCTEVLAERPLTTGLVGVLALLLLGPVSLLLAVSVIGLPIVPALWGAIFVAGLFGRVAVIRWTGARVLAEETPGNPWQAARSLLIGSVLIGLAYLVPGLGILAWTLLGVFGVGAATLVCAAGLRRENAPAFAERPPREPRLAADSVDAAARSQAEMESLPELESAGPAPTDLAAFPRASFFSRFGAAALDALLVAVTVNLLDLEVAGGSGAAFLLAFLAYHIVFWAWKGTTVGGIVCRLRVIRTNGGPLRFADAVIRGLSSVFSAIVAGLGWLWVLWDADRQAWHDKIAGTCVVRVPVDWPLA